MGLLYGENFIIPTSIVFDPCDGRAIAFSVLSIMLSCANEANMMQKIWCDKIYPGFVLLDISENSDKALFRWLALSCRCGWSGWCYWICLDSQSCRVLARKNLACWQ